MADRAVVVEVDFAVLNGAELLFKTAGDYLKNLDGICLDPISEARHLAGRTYQDGLTRLFAAVKTKKTAMKAARELEAAFVEAVSAALPGALTVSFRNFLKTMAENGVRVVLATCATDEAIAAAFGPLLSASVTTYRDVSRGYGSFRWDSWRRACLAAKSSPMSTLAVTGSGNGVKTALVAGLGSVAVHREHVAYQDFGGANEVLPELSGKTARKVLEAMGIVRA